MGRKHARANLEAYEKYGCVSLAADALDVDHSVFRDRLRNHLKSKGEPFDHLDTRHQKRVIDRNCEVDYNQFRTMMAHYGKLAVCDLNGKLAARRTHDIEGELVGIYDFLSENDQMRDDLYWYCINYLGTNNDTE